MVKTGQEIIRMEALKKKQKPSKKKSWPGKAIILFYRMIEPGDRTIILKTAHHPVLSNKPVTEAIAK